MQRMDLRGHKKKDDKLEETAVIKTPLTDTDKFNGGGHLEKWIDTTTDGYNFSRVCRQGHGEHRTKHNLNFLAQIVVSFTEGGTTNDVKGDDGSSLRKVANTSSRNTHV